jgi:hypothetical protein
MPYNVLWSMRVFPHYTYGTRQEERNILYPRQIAYRYFFLDYIPLPQRDMLSAARQFGLTQ